MPLWNQLWMQDPYSSSMSLISQFHDFSLIIITIILTLVGYFIVSITTNSFSSRYLIDMQNLEILWTIIPSLILIFLAIPSLNILYLLEESSSPILSLKISGNQWYWTYEYSNPSSSAFSSYMNSSWKNGDMRLLETDNHLILPSFFSSRMIITATDVIHAWTIPSMGVKADAIPGRLNQLFFNPKVSGIFYGQCSEICGANHSFMPITLETIPPSIFLKWISTIW